MQFTLSLATDVVEAEAGATTPVGLAVANRGEMADRYEIEIEGIDPEWRFIPVPTFPVEPGETREEKIFLKPPRVSESVAGSYPFVVRVRSLESGEARTVQGLLKLRPFHHLTMEIVPKKGVISPTTKRNDFRITVVNLGNSEHTLQLSAQDPDDRCAYEFENDQITLGAGQQREVEVVAEPRDKPLLSSGRLIGFSVVARSLNERNVSATSQAQLEQRSLLSPATLVLAFLIAAIIGGWWMMRPLPPTVDLSISPMRAMRGSKVHVAWRTDHADHLKVVAGRDTVYDGPASAAEGIDVSVNDPGFTTIVATPSRDQHAGEPVTARVQVDEQPVAPLPEIRSFSASEARVKVNTAVVLSWKVDNATKVRISPMNVDLSPELERQEIVPTNTGVQEYTLFAYNADGKSAQKTVKVTVYDESDASILAFTANPPTVREEDGGKTTLSWHIAGAEYVELQIGSGPKEAVDPDGSRDITITSKTQCVLTAYDSRKRTTVQKLVVNYEKTPIIIEPTTPPPGPTDSTTGSTPPVTTTGGTVVPPR